VWDQRIVDRLPFPEEVHKVLEGPEEAVHLHVVVPGHARVLHIPSDVNDLRKCNICLTGGAMLLLYSTLFCKMETVLTVLTQTVYDKKLVTHQKIYIITLAFKKNASFGQKLVKIDKKSGWTKKFIILKLNSST
jgi:hypothetical protein